MPSKAQPKTRNMRAESETKKTRIRQIMRMMTTPGGWQTGRSGPALADEWQVSQNTVERYAAEASRRVREDLFDRDEMRAQLVAQLQVITAVALKSRKTRDAVAAVAEIAKMLGLQTSSEKSVDGPQGPVTINIQAYPPATEQGAEPVADDAESATEPTAE